MLQGQATYFLLLIANELMKSKLGSLGQDVLLPPFRSEQFQTHFSFSLV
jgi:hypothetical protein